MFRTRVATSYYIMPDDETACLDEILTALDFSKGKVYIISFLFSNTKLIKALLAQLKNGNEVHVLLDSSQWNSNMEDIWKPLIDAGVDLTFATSTVPTKTGYEICHTKAIVIKGVDQTPVCITGSTNFTVAGFHQENITAIFKSTIFASKFIEYFTTLKTWCLSKGYTHYN